MGRSSILDGNSFRPDAVGGLGPAERELVRKRTELLGPAYRLFYASPLHVVRGEGAYLFDAEGRDYLDAYNNVPGVGHANPKVAAAVSAQMSTLNTHTRYLQDGIVAYAEDLLSTAPAEIDRVMFTNSGSESNDLALRIAREYSGGTGIVVTAEAYHGTSMLTAGASPAMGSDFALDASVCVIPTPDSYRLGEQGLGEWLAREYAAAVDRMAADGVRPAALLVDTIFSSDGVFPHPLGLLGPVLDAVHDSGAVFIADEVQPGLARTGEAWWGYQRHGIVPDIATSGKAMGNGVPVSAMVIRHEVLEPFATRVPYFNTFGGNPVSIAAAQAVLNEIRDRELMANAAASGAALKDGIASLATRFERIGDVRGAGLYLGVEVVSDPSAKTPDAPTTLALVNAMRERRVLISSAGPANNVLKVRPPLVFGAREVERFLTEFEGALADVLGAPSAG